MRRGFNLHFYILFLAFSTSAYGGIFCIMMHSLGCAYGLSTPNCKIWLAEPISLPFKRPTYALASFVTHPITEPRSMDVENFLLIFQFFPFRNCQIAKEGKATLASHQAPLAAYVLSGWLMYD